jgi:hypothetical protein
MKIEIINGADDSIIESYDSNVVESAIYLPMLHVGDSVLTIGGLHGIIIYKELDIFRKILRIFLSLSIDKMDDTLSAQPQQRNGE